MADPLSLSSGLIAILQVTGITINYLKDVHNAPRDRMDLLVEVSGLENLLHALQQRVQQIKSGGLWLTEVQTLHVPLGQLTTELDRLRSRLEPVNAFKEFQRRLVWTFKKAEIQDILYKIERMKTLILCVLANDNFTLSRAIKEDSSEIKDVVAGIDALHKNKECREITKWLSPLNFKMSQSDIFQKRENGTGQWLLQTQEFKDWRDGNGETLWCSGDPGVGKTVLASIVVDHLQGYFSGENVAIACIYCSYRERTEQTTTNLVASLLKQMVQESGTISDDVESFYRRHETRYTYPTLEEFMATLKAEIQRFRKVFVVVDALDEFCAEDITGQNFLKVFRSLAGTMNIMVTSRNLSPIAQEFKEGKHLEIRANDQDICNYIKGRITRANKPHLKLLQESIILKLVEKARGMFLLAQLYMDSLVGKHTIAAVRRALDDLPKEVDDIYDDAMKRIDRQIKDDADLAKDVFLWITYACRPLSIKELQHALAVTPQMRCMDSENIISEEILTSVCAGLIAVDKEQNIIRLVHYTTQKYFERERDSLFPNAQARITETCLTYLSFDRFSGFCDNDDEFETLLDESPFLDYAAKNWGHHAREEPEEKCRDMAMRFLHDGKKLACASQALLADSEHRFSGYSQRIPKCVTGAHISSFFGLDRLLKHQLQSGDEPDPKDSDGRTPLYWAAVRMNDGVVRLLLTRDDVVADSRDEYGRTPLSGAAMYGYHEVVKLMLARDDVDADSKDIYGQTPLSGAARQGHQAVVELLMAHANVDVNSKDTQRHGSTPLSGAAGNGHEGVVKLFTARGDVEINSADNFGSTPLCWAAENGHVGVVKLLVSRNDIDTGCGHFQDSWTPLFWAAHKGHEESITLLLAQKDVDAGSRDNYGWTPLSLAARQGHRAVVKLLLGRPDVEADSPDIYGQTPLSWAAENGHEEVVKLLLARDDVGKNSKDGYGRTPLYSAAQNGHDGVIKLLVAREDVDVNLKDDLGRTALSIAAENAHEEVVMLLLARDDIDANPSDWQDHWTPLFWAAKQGRETAVKLLLNRKDVKVNSRDKHGQTPLSLAARNGRAGVVKLLLAQDDVNADLGDNYGRTPLTWAAAVGDEQVTKLLIERTDVAVNSKNKDGRTPLSYAVQNGHEEVVRLLLGRSVDADLKDNYGRTPLSWAAAMGDEEIVRMLISRDDVEVDSLDKDHRTPLSWALERGHVTVTRLLVHSSGQC